MPCHVVNSLLLGVGSAEKQLPIWKLLQLLSDTHDSGSGSGSGSGDGNAGDSASGGDGGVGAGGGADAGGTGFDMPQRKEEHPKILRKQPRTAAELEREAVKKEEEDLKAAAAADRLNPQVDTIIRPTDRPIG